ncbi:MAG: 2-hydroxychromene-2-carboxylate isomerase [Gammaproteobacteria bacterium]|nr:2-hydroxychromene-2-carboxylate isomerase [Gammaproteobacteria bacterium]MYI90117.1 2-hydroxychromene-2-carboxylate isomerase [Gammaproteobacteria bacterium]
MRVNKTVDFYFDFSSPYGYFSSEVMDEFSQRCNCEINWRPYVMGAVMKLTGRKPLVQIPMVNEYSARDLDRVARYHQIEFSVPSVFPISSVAPSRAFYWIRDEYGSEKAKQFAQATFRAYFANNLNTSKPSAVVEVATDLDFDSNAVNDALENPDIKLKVREETDRAIERGVFGSPFFIVDDEPFWGHDRLNHVESWLESGGW